MTGSAPNEWMTGLESATFLGVSMQSWYKRISRQIPGHRLTGPGGRLRYRREDLEAWAEKQRVEPQREPSAA